MEGSEQEQALLTALTNERAALQTAYAGTIAEANGRLAVFLSTLSAALIGLGFVVGSRSTGPFLAAVLPILLVLGAFTFFRLVQTMTEGDQITLRIQQIRSWYRDHLEPKGGYFAEVAPEEQHPARATWTAAGVKPRWWQFLFTAAAMVGTINALLLGAAVAAALSTVDMAPPLAAAVGLAATVALFGGQIFYLTRHTPGFPT